MHRLSSQLRIFAFLCFVLNLLAATGAWAETLVEKSARLDSQVLTFDQEYPMGSIQTIERADMAIAASDRLQSAIQALSAEAESACYDRFLVNACIDDARHQRRKWQDLVRRISFEAKAYIRQQRGAKPTKASLESEKQN